jgi:hypothetical protein
VVFYFSCPIFAVDTIAGTPCRIYHRIIIVDRILWFANDKMMYKNIVPAIVGHRRPLNFHLWSSAAAGIYLLSNYEYPITKDNNIILTRKV